VIRSRLVARAHAQNPCRLEIAPAFHFHAAAAISNRRPVD
jgi:hypothetical protein